MVLYNTQTFTKPLKVHDFPCPQKADGVADFLVMDQPEDVVIGGTRFLFCCNRLKTTFCPCFHYSFHISQCANTR